MSFTSLCFLLSGIALRRCVFQRIVFYYFSTTISLLSTLCMQSVLSLYVAGHMHLIKCFSDIQTCLVSRGMWTGSPRVCFACWWFSWVTLNNIDCWLLTWQVNCMSTEYKVWATLINSQSSVHCCVCHGTQQLQYWVFCTCRFDKLVYLGVSKDKDSQLKIMKALTRKYVHFSHWFDSAH